MPHVILFEDAQVESLRPLVLARPAFGLTCGACRLVDWIVPWADGLAYIVRPHLRAIVASDYPMPCGFGKAVPTVLVNGALAPSVEVFRRLEKLVRDGRPGVVRSEGRIAAAVLREDQAPESRHMTFEGFARYLPTLDSLETLEADLPLFHQPHDVIRHHLSSMRANLEHRIASGSYREIAAGVFAAEDAQLGQYLVTDTSKGPIVIESGARIGPFGYLVGPVHIGKNARVIEHAAIKDAVVLGHTTKVGGEVEASIIEPYTNKQHHGFLGHSYLGSWINLGAGTSNSDLKNTYGEVNLDIDGRKVHTGMQFVGCMMGDYSKSAVNTSIFTGKIVGACSLMYGFVTTNVPSFVNYARSFGQVTEVSVDVMVATQARMFARRNVEQRVCDIQLLHDMYELTRKERQLAGEPLAL